MKIMIFTFTLLATVAILNAQTISDIRTEQNGEQINVFYKINNSNAKQLFYITISCLVNDKEKIYLKKITGDVGDNIKGGKNEYKAVWNVLEEVEELNSAEFFVKSELKKDGSTITVNPEIGKKRNKMITYNLGIYTPFGLRLGYLGNWGGYAAFRLGSNWNDSRLDPDQVDEYGNWIFDADNNYIAYTGDAPDFEPSSYDDSYLTSSVTLGVTKRIINTKFKLHGYLGVGYGKWGNYSGRIVSHDPTVDQYYIVYYDNYDDADFEYEAGLIGMYKGFTFSLGTTYMIGFGYWSLDTDNPNYISHTEYQYNFDLVLGLGYTF